MPNLDLKLVLFAAIGGFLPALVWLWFWLREDSKRPEPTRLIVRTFLVGGLFVFIAYVLQKAVVPIIEQQTGLLFDLTYPSWSWFFFFNTIPFLLAWAFIEECVKYLAAMVSGFSNKSFDEPIDAMVYIISAAIGFSAIENTLFLLQTVLTGESPIYFVLTGNLRFLGATVVHIVSSAIVGATLSLSYCASRGKKFFNLIIGLILATTLHACFNFFIITSNSAQVFKIFLVLWLTAILVIYLFEKVKRVVCFPNFKITKRSSN